MIAWKVNHEYTRTNINALSGIRTQGLSVQAIRRTPETARPSRSEQLDVTDLTL
jgi:hypothetical protein